MIMKTDAELQRDVQNQLNWEPIVTAAQIGVTAKDGVVTLTGNVPSYFEKIEAEHVVGRVAGVKGIAEELQVNLPAFSQRTDADIAGSALNALAWDVSVPRDQTQVMVENGWVTLAGQMDWYYQKSAAQNAVRHLMGVKGVSNSITLKPKDSTTAADIKTTIEAAFKRSAVMDAHKIIVNVRDGRVTLSGKARTWAEKEEAGYTAWGAAGVASVDNEVVVSY
jgi:VCBS repeat-containing protein